MDMPARTRIVVRMPSWDGSKLWEEIHRRAVAKDGQDDSSWVEEIRRRVPCGECRRHWDGMMSRTPPDWANYFAWTVDRHNEVNARLGKPAVSIDAARQLWWPA